MQLGRPGKGIWVGIVLIGLAVAVWFVAPQAQSCVVDFETAECEPTAVVVLNIIGLVLFVAGAVCLLWVGAAARDARRRRNRSGGEDTR
jgi:type VI protein secretion system component VasK